MERVEKSSGFIAGLSRRFRSGFASSGRSPWDFSSYGLLPYGISAEINGNDGTLGKQGTLDVVNSGTYRAAGFYLFLKGLEGNREAQHDVLSQAVAAQAQPETYLAQLKDIVYANAGHLPVMGRVKADKLFLISRMQPEVWDAKFGQVIDLLKKSHKGRQKFVLAYAPLSALHHFSKLAMETGEPVQVLVENWIGDANSPVCGYTIKGSSGAVGFLPRDFQKPEDYVLIDDAINTGDSMRKGIGFLENRNPEEVTDLSRGITIHTA